MILKRERLSYLLVMRRTLLNEEEYKLKQQCKDFVISINEFLKLDCVLVGAGRYFDKLYEIQQVTNKQFIKAVCDNNKTLWNTEVNGYTIQSVDYTISQYPDKKWLIANRKYSEEIKKQLVDGGINEGEIVVVDYIPDVLEILDELI